MLNEKFRNKIRLTRVAKHSLLLRCFNCIHNRQIVALNDKRAKTLQLLHSWQMNTRTDRLHSEVPRPYNALMNRGCFSLLLYLSHK